MRQVKKHDIMKPDGEVNPINTDYRVGQDNIALKIGPFGLDIHNRVFIFSAVIALVFVVLALIFQGNLEPIFTGMRGWLTTKLDWVFLLAGNIFVLLCLFLIVSPLGRVRLGGTEAKPQFGYLAWFAMLFAAGMGIGLMFYGVSEPLSHYDTSFTGSDWAPLAGAKGDAAAAKSLAMAASIYHWALHPWAIYAVLALALALFAFNKGLPLTIRSVFYPLLGERVWGWPGHIIDILAIFATLFGLATSLGLGSQQASSGLHFLFGITDGISTQIILVIVITLITLGSVIAGLEVGIRRMSELNMGLALLLVLFVIVVGPTLVILTGIFENLWSYLKNLPALAKPFGREDANFAAGWTAFYWAWWISWSPFVSMFIARISRGRSVREFIIAVLLIPSLVSVIWMTVFGDTAIHQLVQDGYKAAAEAALPLQLFQVLAALPLSTITSIIAIVLVIVFFVTSADSGALVVDTISAGGKLGSPTVQRVFWCSLEGLIAIALLLSGGLVALQAMTVSTGLPFTIVLLVACVALVKGLMSEPRPSR